MRGKCVSDRTVRLLTLPIVAVCGSASAAAAQTTYYAVWDANTDPHTVGYRVFGGVASGAYTWSVDVGNADLVDQPPRIGRHCGAAAPAAGQFLLLRGPGV